MKDLAEAHTIQAVFNPGTEGDKYPGLGPTFGIEGKILDTPEPSLPEFLKKAGRDYFVRKVPAYTLDPFGGMDPEGNMVEAYREVDGQFHLARSSDGAIVSPSTVSNQYTPFCLLDLAEELAEFGKYTSPDAVYSRGHLEMLALRFDGGEFRQEMPDGTEFRHFANFLLPHGTGGKATGRITTIRVVCRNTFAAVCGQKAEIKIAHRTANGDHEKQREIMQARAKLALQGWEQFQGHLTTLAEKMEKFLGTKISKDQALELATSIIVGKGKESAQKTNKIERIMDAWNMPNAGTEGENVWDLYNAFTFDASSPNSDGVKNSKRDPVQRAIANTTANGSGFAFEATVEKGLSAYVEAN